ncbi:MAG: enoyl-CoA hydratase/isomerase family protein [Chloroflexota bacterium]
MPTGLGWDFKTWYQNSQWEAAPYKDRKYSAALYSKEGGIATITLNRPEKRNALNDAMFNDLMAGLHQASHDHGVRAVVIRGAGTNFSSGHDLSSPPQEESTPIPPGLNPTLRDYYGVERRRCGKYEDILDFPKPLIARVHGRCIGAAQAIVYACDLVIASTDAAFGVRGFNRFFLHISDWQGLWPGGSYKQFAGHLTPVMTAEEAEAIGLINKAVPPARLDSEVASWAEALAALPTGAFAVAKRWLTGVADIAGQTMSLRCHYAGHLNVQYVRFRPDEVNFYRVRRDRKTLKGFIDERARVYVDEPGRAASSPDWSAKES